MAEGEPILGYGVARRRLPRSIIVTLIIIAVLIAACFALRPVTKGYWAQWKLLRLQEAVASRILPANVVVYAESEAIIPALLGTGQYAEIHWGGNPIPPYPLPDTWPKPVERKMPVLGLPCIMSGTIASQQISGYLDCWRKDELGNDLIVDIGVSAFPLQNGQRGICLTQATVTRAGWKLGSLGESRSYMGMGILLDPTDRLTLWAPQPDPTDPRRVVVKYEVNGAAGVIVGDACSDGRVRMTVQLGPARVVPKW